MRLNETGNDPYSGAISRGLARPEREASKTFELVRK